jgi:RNA polymerase-binding protein DksA
MAIDPKNLEEIKKELFKEKKRLEIELASFSKRNIHNKDDYNAKFPELGDKEDENATEVALFSDNLTLERTLESALKDVNGALLRIEKGTYGTCQYCGREIDLHRLLARPVSSSCVSCKERLTGGKSGEKDVK